MLSEERRTSRSPSESVQTDSVRTGPTSRLVSQRSQASSITEEDDNDHAPPPPPPFPSGLLGKKKTPSRSSISSSSSTTTHSTSRPVLGGVNAIKPTNTTSFLRPTPRRGSSDQKNQSSTVSASKRGLQDLFGTGSSRNAGNDKSSVGFTPQSSQGKSKQSIFEKVDAHGGGTTYLGSGTFSQLENCIKNCLSQHPSPGYYNDYTTKHHSLHKSLTRASVLEDYSYEGITAPKHHFHTGTETHHHFSHHGKHASELSLEEIRQVNDALSKYGIPVFSHHDYSHYQHNKPRPVGDILSACQQILADPLLHSHNRDAVQHAWDNLHFHTPQTNTYGYPTPAVQGVASHLFGNQQQSPYNPGQNAISRLFGGSQQNSYNPPPNNYGYPPPNNNYNNPPPNNYNNPPPNNYGNPPQNTNSPGQSVLSRLFGGH